MTDLRHELEIAEVIAVDATRTDLRRGDPCRCSTHVRYAVKCARTIRRNLLADDNNRTSRRLTGECGLASARLAIAIGDASSLRLGCFMSERGDPSDHAWNVVDGWIVDITATQFGKKCPAIYLVPVMFATQYIESKRGSDAAWEMRTWDYPAWWKVMRQLRELT
jgi:hypothetical protein